MIVAFGLFLFAKKSKSTPPVYVGPLSLERMIIVFSYKFSSFNFEMSSFARINPKSVKLVKDVTLPLDRP